MRKQIRLHDLNLRDGKVLVYMNAETKQRLLWLSPLTFDGTHAGAFVRTAEMLAADIGLIIVGSKVGLECGGPLAIGTLILMGVQFAACPKTNIERRAPWQKWSLRNARSEDVSVDHEE